MRRAAEPPRSANQRSSDLVRGGSDVTALIENYEQQGFAVPRLLVRRRARATIGARQSSGLTNQAAAPVGVTLLKRARINASDGIMSNGELPARAVRQAARS